MAIPQTADDDATWTRRLVALIAALTVARLAVLLLSPLNLIGDEAYYWDWGRRLDWGYFSKPPMIGWLYGLARALGADSAATVRLPSVFLGVISLTGLALLARRIGGSRAAFWVIVLTAAAPGTVLMHLLLTTDAALLAAWSLSLYALWRWLGEAEINWRWWGLFMGAASFGVLAKQMMLVMPVLALLWLALEPTRRERLKHPLVWLGLLLPAIALLPTLWWNASHDWITAQHTAAHFAADQEGMSAVFGRLGEFIGAEMIMISPPIAWAWLVAAILVVRQWRQSALADRFLWCFCVPPLLVIAMLAFRREIEPNWPSAFWLSGIMLAALRLAQPERKRARKVALIVGVALAGFVVSLPFVTEHPAIRGKKFDPTGRLRGWEDWAGEVQKIRTAVPGTTLWPLIIGDRAYAAQLAFYLPDQPRTYQWTPDAHPISQYGVWPGPAADGRLHSDALIVVGGKDGGIPPEVAACFAALEPLGTATAEVGNGRVVTARLWRARDFQKPLPGRPALETTP